MRKLLLTAMMATLATIGAWAGSINVYPTTINGVDGYSIKATDADNWSAGDLKEFLNSTYTGTVYYNGSQLDASGYAELLANIKQAEAIEIGGSANEQLDVADLNAIEELTGVKYIDMDKATFADGAAAGNIVSVAQYISLPYGTTVDDIQGMAANNQQLLAAASIDHDENDGLEFAGYSFKQAGEIFNICQLGMVDEIQGAANEYDTPYEKNTVTKLSLGGILDDRDVSTSSQDKNWPFTGDQVGAQYSSAGCVIVPAAEYSAATHDDGSLSAVSPWKGNTSIELDFRLATFDNIGDLAVVSNQVTKIALPTGSYFTRIPNYMFANLQKLEEIEIPNNIVTIGDGAFFNGSSESSLQSIKIGNGIKVIGNCAFGVREGTNYTVETINFAGGISDVRILSSAFVNLLGIKHLVLPEGIVSIGEECFLRATTLESVHFPNTLQYIGKNCFQQTGLTSITIPRSVRVIDRGAFGLCSLTDIYLMAETLEELPYIYGNAFGVLSNENYASFGSNSISANNSSPSTTSGWPNSIMQEYAGMTTEEAEEAYRWSIADGNTVACLHYNIALRDFIDYNPWYDENVQNVKPKGNAIVTDPNTYYEQQYLTDTYYYKDADDKTIPVCNAGDYARANWSGYYDYETGTVYSQDAGNTIVPGYSDGCTGQTGEYYNPETGLLNWTTDEQYNTTVDGVTYFYKVLTKEAWRQFVFKRGDAHDDKIVLKKEYQNIWYTMCFPFGLTDEQLESAFNAEYNIADFNAVEITKETKYRQVKDEDDNWVSEPYIDYDLVLHFNSIAKARYFDKKYNEYTRLAGSKGTGTTGDGVTYTTYTYIDKDGNKFTNLDGTFSTKAYAKDGNKENGIAYIDGYLAWPGHPYMIHPNIGTSEGYPAVACYLTNLSFYPLGTPQLLGDQMTTTTIDGQSHDIYTDRVEVPITSWTDLCKANARTVDIETGLGYIGSEIDERFVTDHNFGLQKAYGAEMPEVFEGLSGQTYTFIGNVNEYTDDAPAYPSMDNVPASPIYLTKVEAPAVVENPYPGLVDPATKYSEEFVALYNANGQFYDTDNGWALTTATYGTIIKKNNPAIFASWGDNGTYYYNAQLSLDDLKTYWGNTSSYTETQFNDLYTLCVSYDDDVANYNAAMNSSEYAAYLAYLEDYAAYEEALAAYMAEHPDATPEDIAAYNASVDETNAQLQSEYEQAMAEWWDDYNARVAAWEASLANYKVQIPLNSYFLSRRKGEYYTHFFRNVAVGKPNPWNQYTAIVNPSENALAGIESLLGGVVTDNSTAKGYKFVIDTPFAPVIDNGEQGTVDAIEKIVEEAINKGEDVKHLNIVYSIDGKVMSRDVQSLSGLPTGIYIVNGKKYFVK